MLNVFPKLTWGWFGMREYVVQGRYRGYVDYTPLFPTNHQQVNPQTPYKHETEKATNAYPQTLDVRVRVLR